MGSLSSPVVTSYRLPIVTVGLSFTVFAVLRLVTDRRTDGKTFQQKAKILTVELCAEIDHWFIHQSVAAVHCSKQESCAIAKMTARCALYK